MNARHHWHRDSLHPPSHRTLHAVRLSWPSLSNLKPRKRAGDNSLSLDDPTRKPFETQISLDSPPSGCSDLPSPSAARGSALPGDFLSHGDGSTAVPEVLHSLCHRLFHLRNEGALSPKPPGSGLAPSAPALAGWSLDVGGSPVTLLVILSTHGREQYWCTDIPGVLLRIEPMALHVPGKCRRDGLHPQPQHLTLSTEAAVTASLARSQGPAASANKQAADGTG